MRTAMLITAKDIIIFICVIIISTILSLKYIKGVKEKVITLCFFINLSIFVLILLNCVIANTILLFGTILILCATFISMIISMSNKKNEQTKKVLNIINICGITLLFIMNFFIIFFIIVYGTYSPTDVHGIALQAFEPELVNETFEKYEGIKTGEQVIELLKEVKLHNEFVSHNAWPESEQIKIDANDIGVKLKKKVSEYGGLAYTELKNLDKIESNKLYNIKLNYVNYTDTQKLVNKIVISLAQK